MLLITIKRYKVFLNNFEDRVTLELTQGDNMLLVILIYMVVSVISILILLHLVKTAPTGWEDETGFHLNENGTQQKIYRKVSP